MAGCGECTVCCTVMGIEELRKPPGVPCKHLEPGKGCSIYGFRPQECRDFECLWLQTQAMPEPLSKKMRPDKCGVMFVPAPGSDSVIAAHCDSELSFASYPVRGYVKRWLSNGIKIIRIVGDRRTLMAKVKR